MCVGCFSLTEELLDITPEEELSFWVNSLAFSGSGRAGPGVHPTLARHQSIDAKDATGLLRALEQVIMIITYHVSIS